MTPSTKRSELARLTVVESRFRGAVAASLDSFVLCEAVRDAGRRIVDFRIVEVNERAEQFLRRPRAELIGALAGEIAPVVRRDGLFDTMVRVVESGASHEEELQFVDAAGGTRWARHQVVRVEDGVAITSRDITKRKEVERSLADSERRYRELVESATDAIYRIDPYGVFTYANPVASRLLGFPAGDAGIVGRHYLEFVRRDHHEQGIALYRRQLAERVPVTYWEFPATALDGRELWVGQNVHLEQVNGRIVSLFAVARDITERRLAELALAESEARHRFLAEHSADMLSRHAPDGTLLYVSPVCRTLLGYAADELMGGSLFEYCHPDDLEALRAAGARLLGHRDVETSTYRLRRRDGRYVWLETTSQAVRDDRSGLVLEVLSVSRDITERRRLDEEMRQAQKMDAVSQLAGGVAHDFNNLLTAIRGFADLLGHSLDAGDPRRDDVGEILKATERAAALTRQLLVFSKRQALQPEAANLNTVVDDMVRIVRRLVGDRVAVSASLHPELWTIRADVGQLEQVLLALVLNARDAMPEGGTLCIATRNAELAGPRDDAVLPPGRYAVLEVTDSGAGMNEETRVRAFEPFFTTKDPAARPGLGLAAVYGIVTQNGGHVSIASEPGRGTTVTVHLPVAPAAADLGGPPATRVRSTAGNRILIAEDNEGVRALTVRILAAAGLTVIEACDGVDALEQLERLDEPVDLLVSDIMMPRMNGGELAAHFRRLQPGTPVLLMSGFMDESAVRRTFAEGDAVLAKPFAPDVLLERVHALIGAAPTPGGDGAAAATALPARRTASSRSTAPRRP